MSEQAASIPRHPDERTGCFVKTYGVEEEAVEYGGRVAEAWSDLVGNLVWHEEPMRSLALHAGDALADLLEEIWKRAPDDQSEMNAAALDDIADLMDGQEWSPDMQNAIAERLRRTGRMVRDLDTSTNAAEQSDLATVAQHLLATQREDPEQARGAYPEVGEADWKAIVQLAERLAPAAPDPEVFRAAYTRLEARASNEGRDG